MVNTEKSQQNWQILYLSLNQYVISFTTNNARTKTGRRLLKSRKGDNVFRETM